jgi:hypothetical protein
MAAGKSPTPISVALQARRERAFHAQVGRTMAGYVSAETMFATWFQRLTQMHPLIARRVFYSSLGTYASLQMLRAVLEVVVPVPDIREFLRAAMNKMQQFSETRNRIVHGDFLFIKSTESRYYGQMVIVRGRHPWMVDPDTTDVLTLSNLKMAETNFRRLAFCLTISLNWDGKDPEKSPDRFLPLVRQLPKHPNLSVLDPAIAEQYQVQESELPHWR